MRTWMRKRASSLSLRWDLLLSLNLCLMRSFNLFLFNLLSQFIKVDTKIWISHHFTWINGNNQTCTHKPTPTTQSKDRCQSPPRWWVTVLVPTSSTNLSLVNSLPTTNTHRCTMIPTLAACNLSTWTTTTTPTNSKTRWWCLVTRLTKVLPGCLPQTTVTTQGKGAVMATSSTSKEKFKTSFLSRLSWKIWGWRSSQEERLK